MSDKFGPVDIDIPRARKDDIKYIDTDSVGTLTVEMDADYIDALKFINKYGGVENFRCFALLISAKNPFSMWPWLDYLTWTECKIHVTGYQPESGRSISLEPLDRERFNMTRYSQAEFCLLVRGGLIIPKTEEDQHVQHVVVAEHISGKAFIIHEGDIVV